MIKERLWTRDFVALVLANGFLFAGFHFLLPTITLYAASLGATGGEIGLIGGIFGYLYPPVHGYRCPLFREKEVPLPGPGSFYFSHRVVLYV